MFTVYSVYRNKSYMATFEHEGPAHNFILNVAFKNEPDAVYTIKELEVISTKPFGGISE